MGVPELLSASWSYCHLGSPEGVWGKGIYTNETRRTVTIATFIIYIPGPVLNFAMIF